MKVENGWSFISSFSYACLECTGTTVFDSAYELCQTEFQCKVNSPVASGIPFFLRETEDSIPCSQEPTTNPYREP
jgi:hypothetical protein